MKTKHPSWWLAALVAAQVLYVLGVAAAGYATTALGQRLVLSTRPIDPRDLLNPGKILG